MCRGVRFEFDGKPFEYHFNRYAARLPVRLQSGDSTLVTWGRRPKEAGEFPFGASISLSSVQAGRWDAFQPKPVKIAVHEFMEHDVMGNAHWFKVMPGQYLQGMLARHGQQMRVYVIELNCNAEDTFFERWPRIVNAPF